MVRFQICDIKFKDAIGRRHISKKAPRRNASTGAGKEFLSAVEAHDDSGCFDATIRWGIAKDSRHRFFTHRLFGSH
jgi:hypothetical protein